MQKVARSVLNTNNIDHERTADYATFARALAGHTGKTASIRDAATAPAILLVGGNPTEEHPFLAWNLRTDVRLNRGRLYIATEKPIKLDRQAKATLRLPAKGTDALAAYLDGSDAAIKKAAAFREAVLAEESLLVVIAPEVAGKALADLIAWGLKRGNVRFALESGYANSRGAADMGIDPVLGPGYVPAAKAGKGLVEMVAADSGLDALLVVGSDPVHSLGLAADAFKGAFVIVQDIFLSETAALADVVLPSVSLYEKTGTVTNAFGDVQMLRKAADMAAVKPDFEILVRLAGAMGADVKTLVPVGQPGTTADLGQSRGAQAGEADRHAIWLAANELEPQLSPLNPMALLNEITRTVPGYALDRLNLLTGNAVRTEPGLTPAGSHAPRPGIRPAHDTLFTSGALGRHSAALGAIARHQADEVAATAAD